MTTTTLPERDPKVRPGRNRTGATISKYLCVKGGGAGVDTIALTAADTDVCTGVTREDIVDGANGDLAIGGQVRVTANGAIGADVRITCEANGKVKAAVAGDVVIGVSKEAAAADGDIIIAELTLPAGAVW